MKFSLQCVRKKTVEQVSLENIAESIQRHNWQADMHSKLVRIIKRLGPIYSTQSNCKQHSVNTSE
jgi:hypothetical protein